MSQWKVNAPTLFVLGSLTFLMLLIVVLPDVDLPDTAFHGGTAPVLVHMRATAPPAAVAIAAVPRSWDDAAYLRFSVSSMSPGEPDSNFLPIKLRSIRC